MTLALVAAAGLAFAAATLATAWFCRWAIRHGVLDLPNPRGSHRTPVPRGGGVGIILGFLLGLGGWIALGGTLSPRALGWLAGALLVACVSFLDDLRSLPRVLRLAVHLAGAALLTLVGVQVEGQFAPVLYPLAFLWVVAVTNIYNFMDGIDGLASTQAIAAGMGLAGAGAFAGNGLLVAGGVLLAAATAGFLVHNRPPARIFMGDVGSTFLGFSFAGLPLLANLGVGGGEVPFEVGVVVLAPFLFDGLLTLFRRVVRGERWFEPHRSHYYQRLVRLGSSHGRVTLLYGAAAAGAAALGAVIPLLPPPGRVLAAAVAFLPMLAIVRLTRKTEQRALPPVPS